MPTDWRADDIEEDIEVHEPCGTGGTIDELPLIAAKDLARRPKPQRRFLDSASLLPWANVALLSGDGGIGKSLLALQLAAAAATGSTWIGFDVKSGPALYLSAEDDIDELHIRLADIAEAEAFGLQDMPLTLVALAGRDAVLAAEDHKLGRLRETPLMALLRKALATVKPVLLVIDNLADVFAGNENVRPFAKHFIGMLRGLAIDFDCAVLLLGHPSLSGLNSGSGTSGSTAWSNSVRSRLYLTASKDKSDDNTAEEVDPDQRWLKAMKSNYAKLAEPISLRWQDGRFIRADAENAFNGVTVAHLKEVCDAFRGGAWRYDERSTDWGGGEVARIIGVDVGIGLAERDQRKDQRAARQKVRAVISTWIRSKEIRVVERPDKKRMPRKFFEAL